MAPPLHERLVFDVAQGAVLDAERRYVLMRADVLMGLFANLEGRARDAALEALCTSVAEHGADSVRAYRATTGTDALPAMMEGAAASLGWGRWRFEGEHLHDASPSLALTVENSPFAAAAPPGMPRACYAIAGMLQALGGALWSRPAAARETHCAAGGGDAACRFVVAPRSVLRTTDSPEPVPARRPKPPGDPS